VASFKEGQRGVNEVVKELATLLVDHPDLIERLVDVIPEGIEARGKVRLETVGKEAETRNCIVAREVKTKRKGGAPPANSRVGRRTKKLSNCYYDLLDEDSRIHILSYLEPEDLYEACLASAQLCRDCFHERHPAMKREATVVLRDDWCSMLPRRSAPSFAQQVKHLRRVVQGMATRGNASFGRSVGTRRVVTLSSSNRDMTPVRLKQFRSGFYARGVT
jgi:hypothetical protein